MTKAKDRITSVALLAARFRASGKISGTTEMQFNRIGKTIYLWIRDTNGKVTRSYAFSANQLAELMQLTRAGDFVRHDEGIRLANVGPTGESKDQTHR